MEYEEAEKDEQDEEDEKGVEATHAALFQCSIRLAQDSCQESTENRPEGKEVEALRVHGLRVIARSSSPPVRRQAQLDADLMTNWISQHFKV